MSVDGSAQARGQMAKRYRSSAISRGLSPKAVNRWSFSSSSRRPASAKSRSHHPRHREAVGPPGEADVEGAQPGGPATQPSAGAVTSAGASLEGDRLTGYDGSAVPKSGAELWQSRHRR